ncbi:MAG: hypothetical protein Q9163_006441 [Psora crenata]
MGSIDTSSHNDQPRRPMILFTSPRTTSNLFMHLFKKHPSLSLFGYSFFVAYMNGPEKRLGIEREMANPGGLGCDQSTETFQFAFERLQGSMAKAIHDGRTPLLKEHAFVIMHPRVVEKHLGLSEGQFAPTGTQIIDKSTEPPSVSSGMNPTIYPDHFLQSLAPIILFRHPAKAFPSFLRAETRAKIDSDLTSPFWATTTCLHWQVILFKWYKEQAEAFKTATQGATDGSTAVDVAEPLVIEADDLLHSETLVHKLCLKFHLDPAYVQYQWEAVAESQKVNQAPSVHAYMSTLHNSTGIVKSEERDVDLDLDKEKAKWIEEFGEHDGKAMAACVDGAMDDYYFLREQRLRG